METIAAVRAVHFIRARTHITDSCAGITAVAGAGLADAEEGEPFHYFHHAPCRAEETAPHVGDENAGTDDSGNEYRPNNPLP